MTYNLLLIIDGFLHRFVTILDSIDSFFPLLPLRQACPPDNFQLGIPQRLKLPSNFAYYFVDDRI